jgi:hypothetical protein
VKSGGVAWSQVEKAGENWSKVEQGGVGCSEEEKYVVSWSKGLEASKFAHFSFNGLYHVCMKTFFIRQIS